MKNPNCKNPNCKSISKTKVSPSPRKATSFTSITYRNSISSSKHKNYFRLEADNKSLKWKHMPQQTHSQPLEHIPVLQENVTSPDSVILANKPGGATLQAHKFMHQAIDNRSKYRHELSKTFSIPLLNKFNALLRKGNTTTNDTITLPNTRGTPLLSRNTSPNTKNIHLTTHMLCQPMGTHHQTTA